jgi:acyl-CoA synthetase (AMP-forming)/AMP-acid ligase II
MLETELAENIAEAFVHTAGLYPERTGIIEAKSGKSISFGQLDRRSDAFASHFLECGIQPGEIVMLMVTPSIDFICLALACFKSGFPVVLIDPGMGYKNLLRCIKGIGPDILVGIPKAVAFSRVFPDAFKSVRQRFCCGNSLGLLGRDFRSRVKESDGPLTLYRPREDDLAAIIFTTGSTGPPKGVRYEHSIFSAQLKLIREYYQISPDDIDQPAFPLFAMFSAALGACSVIPDMDATQPAKVNPEKFVSSIRKYGVTYSFGSPAIWNVVSRFCRQHDIVLPSVRKVLMAGAPVPYDLLVRTRKILPPDARIYTPYGATESLPIVSIESTEVINDTWEKTSVGRGTCVGRPLPGIEIRIIRISDRPIDRIKDEMFLGAGEIGEIIVKGDVVTRGYMNNPEETARAKIADITGFWHRMGDVGYLDEKGRLWFCGRCAHRVETKGGTMYTIPCEAVINEHPDVYRSALVGVDRGGDAGVVPVMVIEPHDVGKTGRSVDAGTLLAEVRELAARNRLTSSIQHFMVHRSFPVDIRHNAKIFREKLAQWAQEQIRTEI